MMTEVSVIIYSYKGRILKDVVTNLFQTSSGKRKISVTVVDQHPLDRKKMFVDELSCSYVHIFWDWQNSPCLHKSESIKRFSSTYSMIMSDNVMLSKNWDDELIGFVNHNRVIVSGTGKVSLKSKNKFFVESLYSESDNFVLNQYLDRSLIFGLTSVIQEISYPIYLKYNGEEEVISADLFTKGIDIYGAPTRVYTEIGNNNLEELYVPFSINHNYNEAVSLLSKGSNSFISFGGRERAMRQFNEVHGEIFKTIKPLPFETNDVQYDPQDLNFNKVDARRYVARTKAIH
jgi:hypothetical protein